MIAAAMLALRLQQTAGVTAIVGAPPNDRIYKFYLPQKPTYPAIAFRQVAARRLKGTYDDPGYAEITFQVISLAITMDEAHALDEQIRLALERFGSSQPAGIPFAGGTLYDMVLGSSADGFDEDSQAFFVTTDYTVHHLEVAP